MLCILNHFSSLQLLLLVEAVRYIFSDSDICSATRLHNYSIPSENAGNKSQCMKIVPELRSETLEARVNPRNAGEMGKPHVIENPSLEENELIKEGFKRHSFNEFVSDQISLNRKLPDYRNRWCKKAGVDPTKLLPASIIICFHNEALSVLLRTLHSVLNRSPPNLLKEIILIDDKSSFENLKKDLDEHLMKLKLKKVRLIRSKKRLGLIQARLLGVANGVGPVLIFLDSHIETTDGWLEPLVQRVSENWTNVICPVIDIIDRNTLAYKLTESHVTTVGGFTWNLMFTWKTATDDVLRSLRTPADPVPTPTMAGGLFAIHKNFFNYLGQYDEEYKIWGAENLELSFKVWMCGGRIEISPCSHVGHIFRKRSPYSRVVSADTRYRNYIRLAAVWLDDYAHHFYDRIGNQLGDYGNISARISLRQSLKCQSFDWFLKNVYPDMFNPKTAVASGELRNEGFGGKYCMDGLSTHKKERLTGVYNRPRGWLCHKSGGNQHWYYTKFGEIRRDEICLDFSVEKNLLLYPCHTQKGNQLWIYDADSGFIIHALTQQCLTLDHREVISVTLCQERITQRWVFSKVNPKRLLTVNKKALEWMIKYKEMF